MRLLDRNKRTIKYALCQRKGGSLIVDSDGNYTGERELLYGAPVEIRCNVTSASGSSLIDQFGVNIDYDRTVQIEGTGLGITETTVLWIDNINAHIPKAPYYLKTESGDQLVVNDCNLVVLKYEGTLPQPLDYDYIVVRVAESLTHTTLAVKKVR